MEVGRSAFKILTDKPSGGPPQGMPRRRWKDNIRIALEGICVNTRNWIDSAQDKDNSRGFVNATLNPRVSQVMELVAVAMPSGVLTFYEVHAR